MSYTNPSREEIEREVAIEAALREEMRDEAELFELHDITRAIDEKYGTNVTGVAERELARVATTEHKHRFAKDDGPCAFCGRTRGEVEDS